MISKGKADRQYYEDSQVDSLNCCTPMVRKVSSAHSIQDISKPQPSQKDKQKGITLTHTVKKLKGLTEIKLIIKKSEPLKLGQRSSRKQSENLPLAESNKFNSMSASKKAILAKKCIEYKNQKIQQHNKGEIDHKSSYHLIISSKQQEMRSTRKNTAKTLKNSQDCSFIEKDAHNVCNGSRTARSSLRMLRNQKSNAFNQQKLVISTKQKDCKKTLQRVFEQTQGRKIVTLQSQYSNDEISNDYSIAEHIGYIGYFKSQI